MNAAPTKTGAGRVYWLTRGLMRGLCTVYWRWRVSHPERVPATGPVILASNHVSFADPPLLGSAAQRAVHSLARDSLFQPRLFGEFLRALNATPVDRDGGGAAGLKTALGLLAAGEAVVLFPEGTRSPDGLVHPARAGLGLLVVKSGAPVVPVRLFGVYEVFSRRHRWPRPGKVEVKFGRPLRFDAARAAALGADTAQAKRIYQQIADRVMDEVRRLEPGRELESFPRPDGRTL